MKLFKHIKERGEMNKLYIQAVENDPEINNLNQLKPITYIDNIPVVKHSAIIREYGAIGSMLLKTLNNQYFIIIDESYSMMSLNLKRFVLCHELGHFKLKHLENVEECGLVNNIDIEYEADKYAAELIGYSNAYAAIDELINIINKILDKSMSSNIIFAQVKITLGLRKRKLMK